MINIVVPIDFSETSINAAHYDAYMYANRTDVNIILYHFYTSSEDTVVAKSNLDNLKSKLENLNTHYETIIESGNHFIESLSAFTHIKGACMVIMGLTRKSALAQSFSGSNTLRLAEQNVCPVLIIPLGATFMPTRNVLMASEI
jgi:nucleotide-binding universal stress UspA family protein